MADVFASNFAVPSTTNTFVAIWKLTRCMKAAGWKYKASSDGLTKDIGGTDLWGSNADPMDDVYDTAINTRVAWIVLEGPSTLKIPLTVAPSVNLLRGEKIVQSVSGAEGELLGVVFDDISSTGWAVVAPRTGTFDGANVITSSTSGISFSPGGTVKKYVREVVFSKYTSAYYGLNIYYICADDVGENNKLFSTLCSSSGCTPTVYPGAGGTDNGFPDIALAVRGVGGSINTAASSYNLFATTAGLYTQIGAVNCKSDSSTTADGSFYLACYNSSYTSCYLYMFGAIDNTEPGDIEPYTWINSNYNNFNSFSRTSYTSSASTALTYSSLYSTSYSSMCGYQNRNTSSNTLVPYLTGAVTLNSSSPQTTNFGTSYFRIVNSPAINPPIVRDKLLIVSDPTFSGSIQQYKGYLRWLQFTSYAMMHDTFDGKKWITISSRDGRIPPLLLGPYDGTSIPPGV